MLRLLLVIQGIYYVVSGVWPFVSMRTFEAITGPKTDRWLVRTVGALAAVIGSALLYSASRRKPSNEAKLLALASASAFAAIDTAYGAPGRISRVYLLDAGAEAALAAGIAAASR